MTSQEPLDARLRAELHAARPPEQLREDVRRAIRSTPQAHQAWRGGVVALVAVMVVAVLGTGAGMRFLLAPQPSLKPTMTPALTPGPTPTSTSPPTQTPTVQPAARWLGVAPSPLSPRHSAHAFWTGSEVLVVGGDSAVAPCPGECFWTKQILRDGAAYDPRADTWRTIRPAPVPLENVAGAVFAGDLYLLVSNTPQDESVPEIEAFVRYGIADDRWEELPLPRSPVGAHSLVASSSEIVAFWGTQELGTLPDQVFDPQQRTWTDLPMDPLAPSYDRSLIWTGREFVLVAIRLEPPRAPSDPTLYSAAILNATSTAWRRLPDSEIAGWDPSWHWSGGKIVNGSLGRSDGGQTNNWGRFYPFGGMLEPSSWTWSPLPGPPTEQGEYRGQSVAGTEHVVSRNGWVLEVRTGRWTAIPKPPLSAAEGNLVLGGEAVVWAGDRVMIWGGVEWDMSRARALIYRSTLLNTGSTWRP